MQTRVRVWELNFVEEVKGNGSGFNVTDSSAIARVEVESLSKTGGSFGVAACNVLKAPQLASIKAKRTDLRKPLYLNTDRNDDRSVSWFVFDWLGGHLRLTPDLGLESLVCDVNKGGA